MSDYDYGNSPMTLCSKYEISLFGDHSHKHIEQMPWIELPPGFLIKVIFPFAGAAARFLVCHKGNTDKSISVYLDVKDVLGYVGKPYWEAYPIDGDTQRFLLDETKELIDAIVNELTTTTPE